MAGVMGHVKKSGHLSFSDIKSCVLIITYQLKSGL